MTQDELLLHLIRLGVLNKTFALPYEQSVDWDAMMDQAAEHGVIGFVWDAINKLQTDQKPPRQQMINWGLSAEEVEEAYRQKEKSLLKLVELCRANSIRVLLLKGHGLSRLYPSPEHRYSSDIDIYLFGDYKKGNTVLANDQYQFGGRHSMFMFEGTNVENHVTLIHTTTSIQKKIERYLESTMDNALLTEYGYYVLSPIPNLVFLLMHSLSHMDSRDVISLKNIIDFHIFFSAHRSDIRPKELFSLLEELKMTEAFELMLQLCEWLSGDSVAEYHFCKIPSEDVDRAMSIIMKRQALPFYTPQMNMVERLSARYRRHKQMKWFYRYSPRKLNDRIMAGVRNEVSLGIQRLCGMTGSEGLSEGIRQKNI